jgi:hypothetical protein
VLQKGERVFFADNSKDYLTRLQVFNGTVQGLGLLPAPYGGMGLEVRDSNVDAKMRDDFYGARAIVLYFGSPKDGSNYEDHWVLPELRHAVAAGVDFLIFVSEDFPKAILARHGYDRDPVVILPQDDFGTVLKAALEGLLAP